MIRTIENCSLIQRMERRWEGRPEQRTGKCLGYGRSYEDDEPCDICKRCKLREGYEEDERSASSWNIDMILHDWNSGSSTADLCKKYGFSSPRACRDRISKWRKKGWPFEHHKPGVPKLKRLIQSEEITEGLIRSGRWCD